MSEEQCARPDPDELLKSLSQIQDREKGGKLKIFMGMSAGAGKTYAMLEAAQALIKDGATVIAGVIETHGREETRKLLEAVPSIPPRKIIYRDREFSELDLDTLLARKPEYALVDELAHTNIPGSRHEKRWQDIAELLDHGINVLTTLNIQHVESRKEEVELVTGAPVRETVPDSVIERAEQIELVDIPPETLLERLAEGKVYVPEQSALAAANFFRQDRLTALREIALRFAGDVVGNDLRELSAGGHAAWPVGERVMVAVSHSPHSRRLIRAARKLAFTAESDWLALHVDTGAALSARDKTRLVENLSLARTLGASVITTTDTDMVGAVARVAAQHGVTRLLIGRPQGGFLANWLGPSFLDKLIAGTDIDIHILHERQLSPALKEKAHFALPAMAGAGPYLAVTALVTAVTAAGVVAEDVIGYQSVGFAYLLAVLATGAFSTLGPIMLCAAASALAWDFFFITPRYTFSITRAEDLFMCVAYVLVAAITGAMSHRLMKNHQLLMLKEKTASAMLETLAQFAFRPQRGQCLEAVLSKMRVFFDGSFELVFDKGRGDYETFSATPVRWLSDAHEWAAAKWVMANGREAGWSTDTLSSSQALYIPLAARGKTMGALSYLPANPGAPLSEEAKSLLVALCSQTALYLEQELYREQARASEEIDRSEKLHQAILDSVSSEIKTPAAAISALASALEDGKTACDEKSRGAILSELAAAAERLNREVNNILDMAKLASGAAELKKERFDIRRLVGSCMERLGKQRRERDIEIRIEDGLPPLNADYNLIEQALGNMLSNALAHTPQGARIELSAARRDGGIALSVSDSGQGIPQQYLGRVFDRFFRVPGTASGGAGLGLAIVKAVAELHGGSIAAGNRQGGGAEFSIILPDEAAPAPEDETSSGG
ncbi:MAG: ATP-binding protein [Elusimicrobiales bacterium]